MFIKGQKIVLIMLLIVGILCLNACNKDKPSYEIKPTDSLTPTQQTTPVASTPTEAVTPTPVDDDTPHIVWNTHFTLYLDETAQSEIQQFIYDKGINCRIDFDSDGSELLGDEFEEWYLKKKESDTKPDIIAGCLWEYGVVDSTEFSEKQLAPLNDYIESEKGREIREAYADAEWESVTVNGKIYRFAYRGRDYFDNSIYITVNDRYADYFKNSFDGTYETLREVYNTVGKSDMQILFGDTMRQILLALYGGSENHYSAVYQSRTAGFIDIFQDDTMKDFLLTFYQDVQSGMVALELLDVTVTDKTLAYIHTGHQEAREGFTEWLLCSELFMTDGGVSYGVTANAPHKELAIEVLCACYSDPEIASLLTWGYNYKDAEKWTQVTEYLKTFSSDDITGFIPDLTEEERAILESYGNDISSLFTDLTVGKQSGDDYVSVLNPQYEERLDFYFSKEREYGAIINKMNKQLESWRAGR